MGKRELNQETLFKALVGLRLTERRAEVYIFLAKKAPQKASDIANALKMKNQRLYACLRSLQNRGIITCTEEHSKIFSTLSIEEVLNTFITPSWKKCNKWRKTRRKSFSSGAQ